jgi:hypothetical protein
MLSSPIASLMATESTRRALTEPAREVAPRAPRRRAARVLHAVAVRLDPAVARTSTAAG